MGLLLLLLEDFLGLGGIMQRIKIEKQNPIRTLSTRALVAEI